MDRYLRTVQFIRASPRRSKREMTAVYGLLKLNNATESELPDDYVVLPSALVSVLHVTEFNAFLMKRTQIIALLSYNVPKHVRHTFSKSLQMFQDVDLFGFSLIKIQDHYHYYTITPMDAVFTDM